ncbi:MAG: hypothetical protein AAF985_16530 [Bacteroidota bacterium]
MNVLTTVYLAVSWMLVGLIWVIQLVHYPSFRFIAKDQFLAFHRHHTFQITFIVMPLMLSELGLAIYFFWGNELGSIALWQLIVVVVIWASTFLIQIPMHNRLGEGKEEQTIRQLVNSNWLRTVLWTGKALHLSWYLMD